MRNANIKWIIESILFVLLVLCGVKAMEYVGPVQRFSKKMESEFGGGLQRTVTLYDHNGKIVHEWHGKIDLSNSTEVVDFIVDGRRVFIYGGITVVEER